MNNKIKSKMEKKQSSIEWFFIELMDVCTRKDIFECQSEFKKAKEMYDNEIEKAYLEGMQDCHRTLNKHLEDKTMSKLYTKEMFLIAAEKCEVSMIDAKHIMQYIDEYVTPIQLPTDEELEKIAKEKHIGLSYRICFVQGAKWMRDKIQGGQGERKKTK